MTVSDLVFADIFGSFRSLAHFVGTFCQINCLNNECNQLQKEDGELYQTDKNEIASIVNKLVIVRSFKFRLASLLISFCFLFGGGYNIYRKRIVWGAALFGSGALLGLYSLIDWSVIPWTS